MTSLTANFASRHTVAIHAITRRGLRVRVHCSEACRATLYLRVSGGVNVAKRSAILRRRGSRVLILRLSRSGKRAVAHFPHGSVTLWLRVQSRDGARQTIAHVLRLRP